MAELAHNIVLSTADLDPLPAEVWSVYSQYPYYHKISGPLAENIHDTIALQDFMEYLKKKHSLDSHHSNNISLEGLQLFLRHLSPSHQATMVKLLHGWAPTNAFLHKQGRNVSPLCSRCYTAQEDSSHFYSCSAQDAIDARLKLVYSFLDSMITQHTPIHILAVFEYKLCGVLCLPYNRRYLPTTKLDY